MTRKKIDEMVAKWDTLTEAQQKKVANAILRNKETRDIAANGALAHGRVDTALAIMSDKIKF